MIPTRAASVRCRIFKIASSPTGHAPLPLRSASRAAGRQHRKSGFPHKESRSVAAIPRCRLPSPSFVDRRAAQNRQFSWLGILARLRLPKVLLSDRNAPCSSALPYSGGTASASHRNSLLNPCGYLFYLCNSHLYRNYFNLSFSLCQSQIVPKRRCCLTKEAD